jgi:hypothetical protein
MRFVHIAHAVRAAQAEWRVNAEIEVHRAAPKWWLSRMHRARPDAPRWSGSAPGDSEGPSGLNIHIHLE